MGEAPTAAPHLINSKHAKRPLPILVLLSENVQFGQNLSTFHSVLNVIYNLTQDFENAVVVKNCDHF